MWETDLEFKMRRYKGFSDVVNLKSLYNPIGHTKDVFETAKKGGVNNILDAVTMQATGLAGKGILPSTQNKYIKAAYHPNYQYKYGAPSEAEQKAINAQQNQLEIDQRNKRSTNIIQRTLLS